MIMSNRNDDILYAMELAKRSETSISASKKRKKSKKRRSESDDDSVIKKVKSRVDGADIIAGLNDPAKSRKPIGLERPAFQAPCRLDDVVTGDGSVDYPYIVNDDDHCETPLLAYQHVLKCLMKISLSLNKSPRELRIYDPYYCEGSVVENLGKLGFTNVYNRKEDFYEVQRTQNLPEYDVLLTNPPYSDDHMKRILQFCVSCGRPWFLLLPNYVYTKDYYKPVVGSQIRDIFFISPLKRYLYTTPKGRRQAKSNKYTAPFPTFWYCYLSSLAPKIALSSLSDKSNSDIKMGNVSKGDDFVQSQDYLVTTSTFKIPLSLLPEGDIRKQKERNAKKRKKHKMRKVVGSNAPST